MSTLSIRHPQDAVHQLRGWAASLLIHGLAVVLSVALVSSLRLPPEPKVFTWDVAVVETAKPAPSPPPAQAAPVDPKPAEVSPARPRLAPPHLIRPQPVVQAVQRVETVQALRPVQQEARSVTPLVRESQVSMEPSSRQSAPVVSRPPQSVEAMPQLLSTTRETATTADATPISHERRIAPVAQVVTVAPAVQRETRTEAPVLSNATAAVPIQKEQTPTATAKVSGEPAAIHEAMVRPMPQRKPDDYGWLVDALKKSLQRVRPTLERGGRLRLMLRIRQDGSQVDLVDLAVAESSGYLAVDRKAIEVVRQAFPLEHAGRLENPEVSITMPFRLDVLETR